MENNRRVTLGTSQFRGANHQQLRKDERNRVSSSKQVRLIFLIRGIVRDGDNLQHNPVIATSADMSALPYSLNNAGGLKNRYFNFSQPSLQLLLKCLQFLKRDVFLVKRTGGVLSKGNRYMLIAGNESFVFSKL